MNSPSERFTLSLATPDDGAELAELYRSDDGFPGDIQVLFARGEDAYASLLAEGDSVVVPIFRDPADGRLAGMGACIVRHAWVGGVPRTVGYLTGMKVLPQYRRRVPGIPQVYALLREQTRDVECYYTTILASNTMAQRMLERRRPGMPEYRRVDDYTTFCFRVGRRPRSAGRLTGGTLTELAALSGEPGRFNLTGVEPPRGITDADVRVLREGGVPVAGGVVWNQRAEKQYIITGYGGAYARLARLPVHWLGYPRLPAAHQAADYVSVALLAARDDDPDLIQQLLTGIGWEQRARDFVMVGLVQGHPFTPALDRLRTIHYRSTLYTVAFEGTVDLDERPVALDVGLL